MYFHVNLIFETRIGVKKIASHVWVNVHYDYFVVDRTMRWNEVIWAYRFYIYILRSYGFWMVVLLPGNQYLIVVSYL